MQDWGFSGIEGASEAIPANFGLKPIQTANRCACLVAVLDDELHGNVIKVLASGVTDLFSGEDAPELEEMTIHRVVEIELVNPTVHHAHKFARVDLHTWNENS